MSQSSAACGESVRVMVRVRPMNSAERGLDCKTSWKFSEKTLTELDGSGRDGKKYSFDNVFTQHSTQSEVFDRVGFPVVEASMRGFNGTVFAYGQTSSGKTHSLSGSAADSGIIPRSVDALFTAIASEVNTDFLVRVQYLEIYQENVRDLLNADDPERALKVVDDKQMGCSVPDAREVVVLTKDHVLQLLEEGEKHRSVGATDMNEQSSRSHTLFKIVVESKATGGKSLRGIALFRSAVRKIIIINQMGRSQPGGGSEIAEGRVIQGWGDDKPVRVAHINLVDLAGSERVSKTNAKGTRLKEGAMINQSLSILGNCIKKLSEGNAAHINFRDSKLTRLLSHALGGNSKTTVLCCISPADRNFDETRGTLQFASRAKKIVNSVVKNEIKDHSALLVQYRAEVETLKQKLAEGACVSECGDVTAMQQMKEDYAAQLTESKSREAESMDFIQQLAKFSQNPELRVPISRLSSDVAYGRRRKQSVVTELQNLAGASRFGSVAQSRRTPATYTNLQPGSDAACVGGDVDETHDNDDDDGSDSSGSDSTCYLLSGDEGGAGGIGSVMKDMEAKVEARAREMAELKSQRDVLLTRLQTAEGLEVELEGRTTEMRQAQAAKADADNTLASRCRDIKDLEASVERLQASHEAQVDQIRRGEERTVELEDEAREAEKVRAQLETDIAKTARTLEESESQAKEYHGTADGLLQRTKEQEARHQAQLQQIAALNSGQSEANKRREDSDSAAERLRDRVEELSEDNAKLTKDVVQGETDLHHKQEDMARLQRTIKTQEDDKIDLQRAIDRLESEVGDAETRRDTLQQDLSAKHEASLNFQESLRSVERDHAGLGGKHELLLTKLETATQELAEVTSKFDDSRQDAEQCRAAIQDLEVRLNAAGVEGKALSGAKTAVDDELQEAQSAARHGGRELQQANDAKQVLELKLEQLEHKLEGSQTCARKSQADLEDVVQGNAVELSDLQAKLAGEEQRSNALSGDVRSLTAKAEAAEKQVAMATSELDMLQQSLSREQGDKENVERTLTDLTRETDGLRKTLARAQQEGAEAAAEVQGSRGSLEQLKKDIEGANKRADVAEKEHTTLKRFLEDSELSSTDLEAKHASVVSMLSEANTKVAELQATVEDRQRANEGLQRTQAKVDQEFAALTRQLEASEVERGRTEERIAKVRDEFAVRDSEANATQRQLRANHVELDTAKRQSERATADHETASKLLEGAQERHAQQVQEFAEAELESKELAKELARTQHLLGLAEGSLKDAEHRQQVTETKLAEAGLAKLAVEAVSNKATEALQAHVSEAALLAEKAEYYKADLNKEEAAHAAARAKLQESETMLNEIKLERSALVEEVEGLTTGATQRTEDQAALEGHIAGITEELDKETQLRQSLHSDHEALKLEHEGVVRERDRLDQSVGESSEVSESLRKDLETARQEAVAAGRAAGEATATGDKARQVAEKSSLEIAALREGLQDKQLESRTLGEEVARLSQNQGLVERQNIKLEARVEELGDAGGRAAAARKEVDAVVVELQKESSQRATSQAAVERQLRSAQDDLAAAGLKATTLSRDMSTQEEEIGKLNAEAAEAKERMQELQHAQRELESTHQSARLDAERALKEGQDTDHALHRAQDELVDEQSTTTELRNALAQQAHQLRLLEEEVQRATRAATAEAHEREATSSELTTAVSERDRLSKELAEALQSAGAVSASESNLQRRLSDGQAAEEAMREDLESLRTRCKEQDGALATVEHDLRTAVSERDVNIRVLAEVEEASTLLGGELTQVKADLTVEVDRSTQAASDLRLRDVDLGGLQRQVKRLESEAQQSTDGLKQGATDLAAARAEVDNLTRSLHDVKSRQAATDEQLAAKGRTKEETDEQLRACQAELANSREQGSRMSGELSEACDHKARLQTSTESLRRDCDELRLESAALKNDVNTARQSEEDRLSHWKACQQELRDVARELESTERERARAVHESELLEATCKGLRKDLDEESTVHSTARHSIALLQEEGAVSKRREASLQDEISTANDLANKLRVKSEAHESSTFASRGEAAKVHQELVVLKETSKREHHSLTAAEDKLTTTDSMNTTLQARCTDLSSQLREACAQLEVVNDTSAQLDEALQQSQSCEKAQSEANQDVQGRLRRSEERAVVAEGNVARLEDEVQSVNRKAARDSADRSATEGALERTRAQVTELMADVSQLKQASGGLEQDLKSARRASEQHQSKVTASEAALAGKQTELVQRNEEATSLRAELGSAQAAAAKLGCSLQETEASLADAGTEAAVLREKAAGVVALRAALAREEKERTDASTTLVEVDRSLRDERQTRVGLEGSVRELRAKLVDADETVETLRGAVSTFEQDALAVGALLTQTGAERDHARGLAEGLSDDYDLAASQRDALENEVGTLTTELASLAQEKGELARQQQQVEEALARTRAECDDKLQRETVRANHASDELVRSEAFLEDSRLAVTTTRTELEELRRRVAEATAKDSLLDQALEKSTLAHNATTRELEGARDNLREATQEATAATYARDEAAASAATLGRKYEEAAQAGATARARVEDVTNEMDGLRQTNAAVKEEAQMLSYQREVAEAEQQRLHLELGNKIRQDVEAQSELTALRAEMHRSIDKVDRSANESLTARESVDLLAEQVSSLREQLQVSETTKLEAREGEHSAKLALRRAEEGVSRERAEMASREASGARSLAQEVDQLRTERDVLQDQLRAQKGLDAEVARLKRRLADVETSRTDTEAKLQLHDQSLSTAQGDLDRETRAHAELRRTWRRRQASSGTGQLQQVIAEKQVLEEGRRAAESAKSHLEQQFSDLNERLVSTEGRNRTLERLSVSQDALLKSSNSVGEQAMLSTSTTATQLMDSEAALRSARVCNASLSQRLVDSEDQVDKLRLDRQRSKRDANHGVRRVHDLESERAKTSQYLHQSEAVLGAEIGGLVADNDGLKKQLASVHASANKAEAMATAASRSVQHGAWELEQQLHRERMESTAKECEIATLHQTEEQLQQELRKSQASCLQRDAVVRKLNGELQMNKMASIKRTATEHSAHDELHDITDELKAIRLEWEEAEQERRQNDGAVHDARQRLKEEKQRNYDLEQKVSGLTTEVTNNIDDLEIFRHLDILNAATSPRESSSPRLYSPRGAAAQHHPHPHHLHPAGARQPTPGGLSLNDLSMSAVHTPGSRLSSPRPSSPRVLSVQRGSRLR